MRNRSMSVLSVDDPCYWIEKFSDKASGMVRIRENRKQASKKNKGRRRKNVDIVHR